MPPPQADAVPPPRAPNFYVTARKPLSPVAVVLAVLVAAGGMSVVAFGLNHHGKTEFHGGGGGPDRGGGSAGSSASGDDDNDDPSQVDYVVIGDPADAPEPAAAHRRSGKPGTVHPTIVVRLPRSGTNWGLIPSSPAGRLLYSWLAAFNQASAPALAEALPSHAPVGAVAAQMALRQQTGGYNLLSAIEVQPGLIVFRLRDQTPAGGEALGTLQVRPGSGPAEIGSFSLRAVDTGAPAVAP